MKGVNMLVSTPGPTMVVPDGKISKTPRPRISKTAIKRAKTAIKRAKTAIKRAKTAIKLLLETNVLPVIH